MKKTLILTVMLAVSGISIFANPDKNPEVESAFKKHFAGASHVKWSTVEGGYLQAAFVWAGHRTIAYFTPDAEFAGTVRNLFFNQLPLTVMRSIEKQFGGESVIEIREITNDEGTHYAITVDQKNKRYKVKLNSAGEILQKERVKK